MADTNEILQQIDALDGDRFILVIHLDDEGNEQIRIEATKEAAKALIKILGAQREAVKKGKNWVPIFFLDKSEPTADEDLVFEKFGERFEDMTDAIKKAMRSDAVDDPMYF